MGKQTCNARALKVLPMFISPSALKEQIEGKVKPILLDVRDKDEYHSWHIPDALNLPVVQVLSGNFSLPKDRTIVTICQHGGRSAKAADYLRQNGYHKVSTLKGGIVQWNSVYDVVDINPTVVQFKRVGKGCLSHLLIIQKEVWVIDPTIDIDVFLKEAKKRELKVGGVLDTHAHADHVSGGRLLSQKAGVLYFAPSEVSSDIADPRSLPFIQVLSTPGHTPGSVCYLFDEFLFTGDTLFVESVGRPDLGQDAKAGGEKLYKSLQEIILNLPQKTVILPAHVGETVTTPSNSPVKAEISELKQKLPALSMSPVAFVDWITKSTVPKPGNFETIKKINTAILPLPPLDQIRDLEAGPNRCAVA